MKLFILLLFLCFTAVNVKAQSLSVDDMINTFSMSKSQMEKSFLDKGFRFFKTNKSPNGSLTDMVFTSQNEGPKTIFSSDWYDYKNELYNYLAAYTTTSLEEYKQLEKVLINKKFEKDKGKSLSYKKDGYDISFEVIKVSRNLNAYRIKITNYNIAPSVYFQALLEKADSKF